MKKLEKMLAKVRRWAEALERRALALTMRTPMIGRAASSAAIRYAAGDLIAFGIRTLNHLGWRVRVAGDEIIVAPMKDGLHGRVTYKGIVTSNTPEPIEAGRVSLGHPNCRCVVGIDPAKPGGDHTASTVYAVSNEMAKYGWIIDDPLKPVKPRPTTNHTAPSQTVLPTPGPNRAGPVERCLFCNPAKCQGMAECSTEKQHAHLPPVANEIAKHEAAREGGYHTPEQAQAIVNLDETLEEMGVPLPPPDLGDYAAVWNGLQALTTPGNPLAALEGVRMAEFPTVLGEWIAGFEEYPYNHGSELEAAVKEMLDAITYQGDRLVGAMYQAHEKLKAAYQNLPSGEPSPTLREYGNFWLGLRRLLMQPGAPCHGLAPVPIAEVPQALYDFIADLMSQVEMANARAHGLGLLSQRLTKQVGRHHANPDARWVVKGVEGLDNTLYVGILDARPYSMCVALRGNDEPETSVSIPRTKAAIICGELLMDIDRLCSKGPGGILKAHVERVLAVLGWRNAPHGPASSARIVEAPTEPPWQKTPEVHNEKWAGDTAGVLEILAERQRQLDKGFTPKSDLAVYRNQANAVRKLTQAATCYVLDSTVGQPTGAEVPLEWPWDATWWQPGTPEENLAKAGALIAAAIDVIQYSTKQA